MAKYDSYEVLEVLCKNGGDPNAKDTFNNTPLHLAIENNSLRIAEILCDNGADLFYNNTDFFVVNGLAKKLSIRERLSIIKILKNTKSYIVPLICSYI